MGESLPPAAKRIFKKLGLPNILSDGHLSAIGMSSWWGSEHVQISDHLRNPEGAGWHLDRQLLETSLRSELLQSELPSRKVACYWPYSLKSSEKVDDAWQLNFNWKTDKKEKDPETPELTINAKLVIDATGRHCTFARQQGATRQQEDRLVSVWLTFQTQVQNKLAHICPVDSGWWYCAPIPRLPQQSDSDANSNQQARILSFQTDADLLPKAFTDKQALWQAALAIPQFSEVLNLVDEGTITHHGKVAANSSLLSNNTVSTSNGNWFAIGDAAMSFDPLSSQGMFNAMATAMQLSDLIMEKGIQSEDSLRSIATEYEQQRERIWRYYQYHKQLYYRQERRWRDSEFWGRR